MQPATFREPVETESLLDSADGLSWKTLCRCDLPYTINKSNLRYRIGEVALERRRDIARKIVQGLAIAGL